MLSFAEANGRELTHRLLTFYDDSTMIGPNQAFSTALLAWYDEHRRDLPWRVKRSADPRARIDAYHVLVSEFMLQQTQAATVIPYFHRFLEAFPKLEDLAAADEQRVLRLWQGLGYYSRARRLQATAKAIVSDHAGKIPSALESLLSLPGVGRYTAGAIASIAFENRAPILDGNVIRVITRLDAVRENPREPKTLAKLWRRAEEILPQRRVGDFNSALMELGATVCRPRTPACLICPVKQHCRALAKNLVDEIPLREKSKPTPRVTRWTIGVHRDGKFLIEQRPVSGRWAGMWQFVTIDPAAAGSGNADSPTRKMLREQLGFSVGAVQGIGGVDHALTHRRYHFDVFVCEATSRDVAKTSKGSMNREWRRLDDLADRPFSRPQLLVAEMLGRQAT